MLRGVSAFLPLPQPMGPVSFLLPILASRLRGACPIRQELNPPPSNIYGSKPPCSGMIYRMSLTTRNCLMKQFKQSIRENNGDRGSNLRSTQAPSTMPHYILVLTMSMQKTGTRERD